MMSVGVKGTDPFSDPKDRWPLFDGASGARRGCAAKPPYNRAMRREVIIHALVETLATTREEIVCAYLFGSVARGADRSDSDLDVAVLFADPPPRTLMGPASRLQGELEQAVRRPVDLVTLNDASPDLVHRVLRDGILLNENDRNRRVAFEVQLRNAYFDILPYLEAYRAGGRS